MTHTQCDHRIRAIVKRWELPKSTEFSGGLPEIVRPSSSIFTVSRVQWDVSKERSGLEQATERFNRLWGESVPFWLEGGQQANGS